MLAAVLDALAVLAPTECSGCGAVDRALCPDCLGRLTAAPRSVRVGDTRPLEVWSALEYEGVVRRVLLGFKDGGRTDAAGALAAPLRFAIAAALAPGILTGARCPPDHGGWADGVELVTIPSTRAAFRSRGYRPVELLLSHARLRAVHPLASTRQTEDQAGLGRDDRRRNRSGSLVAGRPLTGRVFLLVDDILTTGSTLLEARRAIEAGGGIVIAGATIAVTRRLSPQFGSR